MHFLADIFDLANSAVGEPFVPIRNSVILPRGATITRILIASLTGALPKSRVEVVVVDSFLTHVLNYLLHNFLIFPNPIVRQVSYPLLALTRAFGMQALEWEKECVSLIPSTAVTDVERARFLNALSDAASGGDTSRLNIFIEEFSDVCRRNRAVQEIVQEALRPLELNLVRVSSS